MPQEDRRGLSASCEGSLVRPGLQQGDFVGLRGFQDVALSLLNLGQLVALHDSFLYFYLSSCKDAGPPNASL